MLGKAFANFCPAPSRSAATLNRRMGHSRRITLAYAQQLTVTQAAGIASDGKSVLQVQVTRSSLPCEKPLPLASVLEVQRLLFLLEAPEYCMRAFREHGVNGQDLMHMLEEDLEDSRFKFPKNVQRKVLRIAEAWRLFQDIAGSPTARCITLEQFLSYYSSESSAEGLSQLQTAFSVVDVNNNGDITFEEFLVGFSLLEASVTSSRAPAPDSLDDSPETPATTPDAMPTTPATQEKWLAWLSMPPAP